jgi:hypothetical protein
MSLLRAEETPYLVESTAGIAKELSKEENQQPFKDWLKTFRPKQYENLFGVKPQEPKDEEKKSGGDLFSAMADLNAAIFDPQVARLDYYVNLKAAEGWEVISVSEQIVVFRRQNQKKANKSEQATPRKPSD